MPSCTYIRSYAGLWAVLPGPSLRSTVRQARLRPAKLHPRRSLCSRSRKSHCQRGCHTRGSPCRRTRSGPGVHIPVCATASPYYHPSGTCLPAARELCGTATICGTAPACALRSSARRSSTRLPAALRRCATCLCTTSPIQCLCQRARSCKRRLCRHVTLF